MSIVSCRFFEFDWQVDGITRTVREELIADDGQVYGYQWTGSENAEIVLQERVDRINERLIEREAAQSIAKDSKPPITKLTFRNLFLLPERMAIDEFNQRFESNPILTDQQKAMIRTGLLDFDAALSISVPFVDSVLAMLDLYVSVGILSSDRANEIIAWGQHG